MRRELVADIHAYHFCGGEVNSYLHLLKWGTVQLEEGIAKYWDLVPAHPCVDLQADVDWCLSNAYHAGLTRLVVAAHVSACSQFRDSLRALIKWVYGL